MEGIIIIIIIILVFLLKLRLLIVSIVWFLSIVFPSPDLAIRTFCQVSSQSWLRRALIVQGTGLFVLVKPPSQRSHFGKETNMTTDVLHVCTQSHSSFLFLHLWAFYAPQTHLRTGSLIWVIMICSRVVGSISLSFQCL